MVMAAEIIEGVDLNQRCYRTNGATCSNLDPSTSTKYTQHVVLHNRYKPLIQRGHRLDQQLQRSTFPEKRKHGATNLDLWTEGGIYPIDPRTGRAPPFQNIQSLIEYVCSGEDGLLGYSKVLDCKMNQYKDLSMKFSADLQSSAQAWSARENAFCHDKDMMLRKAKDDTTILQRELDQVRLQLQQKSKTAEHARMALQKARQDCRNLKRKFGRRVNTPIGNRLRVRPMKDLSDLSQRSGNAKRRKRHIRLLLATQAAQALQTMNATYGSKRRLCGNTETQVNTATVLASLITKTEASAMLQVPKLSNVATAITNDYLDKIGSEVGPQKILATCDTSAVSQNGYAEIFKTVKGGVQRVDKRLNTKQLPKPYSVTCLRRELNSNLTDLIGDWKYIDNTYEAALTKKAIINPKVDSRPSKLVLTKMNNLFADVEVVQRNMVLFYDITIEQLGNRPLIFVLKLDEAKIVNDQKFERVSLTLMSKHMNLEELVDSVHEESFSVQSEWDIWPICCFQLESENHDVLKWVFSQTQLPSLIQTQGQGQKLQVPGVGDFNVEWHLSGDMKTLKCLYGLAHGANASHSCIFCNQEHQKPTVLKHGAIVKRSIHWKGGLFSEQFPSKPSRGPNQGCKWDPIFAIPLERVHICTLHCNVRIAEKFLHLHFIHVWNIRELELQKQAIAQVENALNKAGIHGGNVAIIKDPKRSGPSNSVPHKLSLSGANANKLYQPSSWSGLSKVWKDIVIAENNRLRNGASKAARQAMWESWEAIVPYFRGSRLAMGDRRTFKEKVEKWGRIFVEEFGEDHVTHYVHVLVKHAPWYIEEYGSLSIWSMQGMEKSHHQAKTSYSRHTQHGGSNQKKSPITQVYEHWYRCIQHRIAEKSARTFVEPTE